MPDRIFGNPITILSAVNARLISQVSGLTAANCFIALNPDQTPAPSAAAGGFIVVVSPTSGTFDESMFAGGGGLQLTTNWGLVTKIHDTVVLDPVRKDVIFLTDTTKGILAKATAVLKALVGNGDGWSPLDASNNPMTRDPLVPTGFSIQRQEDRIGSIEIEWKVLFDWDLTP